MSGGIRRWCETCQDFTYSVMVDGVEMCENWGQAPHDDDDWDG